MYNLYPSMKYRLGALDIIQPTVGKQLKESYARTQHLEGRTAMSETMESLEKDRQIPRNLSHPTDIYICEIRTTHYRNFQKQNARIEKSARERESKNNI